MGVIFGIPGCFELSARANLFAVRAHGGSEYSLYHYFDSERNGRKPLEQEVGCCLELVFVSHFTFADIFFSIFF